jgi:hypothetical protein
VLEHLQVARPALLPQLHLLLPRIRLPTEELGAHLEEDLLVVLSRFHLHLVQLHERLELDLGLLLHSQSVVIIPIRIPS